jgi:hypothetical protein
MIVEMGKGVQQGLQPQPMPVRLFEVVSIGRSEAKANVRRPLELARFGR